MDPLFLAVFSHHAVGHRRRGGNQVEAELALQAVAGDFHVQQSQEAAAETKSEGDGGFGLEGEGGVVKLQLFQSIAQVREVGLGNGEKAGVNHRVWVLVSLEWGFGSAVGPGDGIAHLGLTDVFYAGNKVAHLAGA